jgi:hypothetical protein
MRTFTLLVGLFILTTSGAQAQAPNNGFYVNSIAKDVFKIPDSDVINHTQINNRTYETYFYANSTVATQFIFMEGDEKRGILAYVENGYLIVGAYAVDNDYTNIWPGTYFRKPISAGTWYHVALVFDGLAVPTDTPLVTATDNTNFKWYVDGVLQDEKAGFQIGGNGNHNNLNIGFKDDKLKVPAVGAIWTTSGLSEYAFGEQFQDDGGGEYYFDGYIWGFRVWDTARTATEINDNKTNLFLQPDDANLLAVLDGDTVTYLDNNSLPDVRDSEGGLTVKEWEGNTDSNWNTATNWKNDLIPDNAKQEPVLIKKQSNYFPEINTTVVTGDIAFEYHDTFPGKITIQDGGTLDIAYDLLNDGEIIIEDNGALQVRETNPITGVGSVSISRNTPDYPADFYSVWSTPVAETDSQINTIFTNGIITYEYDSSQNPMAYVQLPNTANMEVGKGYFIRSDSDSGVITRTFSGTLNNGNIDIPIYYNGDTDKANLIGNPYASAINWKTFYENNSDVIEGTMYFWSQSIAGPNNSAGDYKSYNYGTGSADPGITEFIAAGQGVFVKSLPGGGTATFKNSQKVSGNNDQFLRTAENEDDGKSWFRLSGSMGYSPILLGFIPGATDGYESNYDATFISEGATIEFYSLMGPGKYEIQGRSELCSENKPKEEIPLGFEVTSAGDYTISIVLEYIDPMFEILLEDKLLGITTDLRQMDYTFNVPNPMEDHNRFLLHYDYNAALGTDDFDINENEVHTYFLDDQLYSNSGSMDPRTIQLFDVIGKEVINTKYEKKLSTKGIRNGLYVVKYSYENSKTVSKKVIKR